MYLSPYLIRLCAFFDAAESDESVVDRSYVKKKLEHGLTRIWQV